MRTRTDNLEIVSANFQKEDVEIRPNNLNDFLGQKKIKANLSTYIQAAKIKEIALDHVLFSGPPGLGKTTLARILASEMGSGFHQLAAPNINRPGDLAKILTTISLNDILFIDEIHRLNTQVEEVLYSAMEDFRLDIAISEGMGASAVKIELPRFTLVAATTRPGSLTGPLRDRFGIQERLEFYTNEELTFIILRACKLWSFDIDKKALEVIAQRSRSTPRIALRLLRRVSDFALVWAKENLTKINFIGGENVIAAFEQLEIDDSGLTSLDRELLTVIAKSYHGGPVGLKPLAAILSEDVITLEDFIEPFLVKSGYLLRTSRGRMLSETGYEKINISKQNKEQDKLF